VGFEIVTESSSKSANVVAEFLRSWNPKAVAEVVEFRGETTIVVPRELLRATAEHCREDAKLKYNLLTDATCVDRYPADPRFELNYHLVSISRREKVRLRVWLSGNDPVVDSLVPVWPGANWLTQGQHMHLIHHMMVWIPYYQYEKVFHEIRPYLEQSHAMIDGFWPREATAAAP